MKRETTPVETDDQNGAQSQTLKTPIVNTVVHESDKVTKV